MADRGDTHYKVSNLNRWFFVSSVLLLISSIWMVWDDWAAEWKPYQREFRSIEAAQTRAQLESMQAEQALERELQQELDAIREGMASQAGDIAEARAEAAAAKATFVEADRQLKNHKAQFGWEKYLVDRLAEHAAGGHGHGAEGEGPRLALTDIERQGYELALEKEAAELRMQEANEVVTSLEEAVTVAESNLKRATKDLELARNKLNKLDPEAASQRIANIVRDFPGLDFVDPNLKVRKVVMAHITDDLNFTKKPRIDMCQTCHMGIDRPGFEDEEQPYTTHPNLDLFLSAASPHPLNEVGCTSCHRGAGEALGFQHSDHRPADDAQRDEWAEEHHWHKQHHWDYPMLKRSYIEASCVQCHTTSMELLADDAPTVTKGYRLFEESGCYSCHKVEWFPTKRKRGPSLKNLQAKLKDEFIEPWVADPKAFRPTSRMPQIFHLENYKPDEVLAISKWGQGDPILGQQWNDTAVAAVSAFIRDRAPLQPLPEPPVEGDVDRGREAFRLSGCLSCHNIAPQPGGEDDPYDFADDVGEYNTMGPNLRGVATKLEPNWLYWWIKDPTSYWPDTRMPNLRLSDEEAADIAAYMEQDPDGFFSDVPEEWDPQPSPVDRATLEEQARWFFSRLGQAGIEARLAGEWADDQKLLVDVGEKFVMQQGCFSCHDIAGLEAAMPIGTELTKWGSKTVDKLDFGALHEILAAENDWDFYRVQEFKTYREGWIENKLLRPRRYDELKVKNPMEKLKMPNFDFTEEEAQAIATFVVGLVDDNVNASKMFPTQEQAEMDAGLRAVRQNNCAACHVIEPGTVRTRDEDGVLHELRGEILALDGALLPPPMRGLEETIREHEEYMQEDDDEFVVEELYVRLLEPAPSWGKGYDVGDVVAVPLEGVEAEAGWGGEFVRIVTDYYINGIWAYDEESDDYVALMPDPNGEGAVRDVDGEFRLYSEEPYDKVRWTFAPPFLTNEGEKLQRPWFYAFLNDPMPLREQMRVRMPSFHWDAGEAEAIAGYFAYAAVRAWPGRFSKRLQLYSGLSRDALAEAAGIQPSALAQLERGSKVHTQANLGKLLAQAAELGFTPSPSISPANPQPNADGETPYSPVPPVDPGLERPLRRDATFLAHRLTERPEMFADADALARGGPNCFQCHFLNGSAPLDGAAQPIAWAPDLYRARERLREDWVHAWLKDPARVYPGTAMPANFSAIPPAFQDLDPDSSNEDQIQLIMDWLFNLDRVAAGN